MAGWGPVFAPIWKLHPVIWPVLVMAIFAGAQNFPSQIPGQGPSRERNPFAQPPGSDPLYEERRLNALNADRHKSLVSDTEKLLRLAKQLDEQVASNTADGLTPKELKEIAEIEKLARNVKEKMARSYGDGTLLKEPSNPMVP